MIPGLLRLGASVGRLLEALDKRVVVVVSSDLAHTHLASGPYGQSSVRALRLLQLVSAVSAQKHILVVHTCCCAQGAGTHKIAPTNFTRPLSIHPPPPSSPRPTPPPYRLRNRLMLPVASGRTRSHPNGCCRKQCGMLMMRKAAGSQEWSSCMVCVPGLFTPNGVTLTVTPLTPYLHPHVCGHCLQLYISVYINKAKNRTMVYHCNSATVIYHCNSATVIYHCNSGTVIYHCNSGTVIYHCNSGTVIYHCNSATVIYHCNSATVIYHCNSATVIYHCKQCPQGTSHPQPHSTHTHTFTSPYALSSVLLQAY
jgi:hypothetical protein